MGARCGSTLTSLSWTSPPTTWIVILWALLLELLGSTEVALCSSLTTGSSPRISALSAGLSRPEPWSGRERWRLMKRLTWTPIRRRTRSLTLWATLSRLRRRRSSPPVSSRNLRRIRLRGERRASPLSLRRTKHHHPNSSAPSQPLSAHLLCPLSLCTSEEVTLKKLHLKPRQ